MNHYNKLFTCKKQRIHYLGGFMKLKLAFAVATIVASGVVFAQNTPQKSTQKPTQVAQGKPGAQALGASSSAAPVAAAPFGIAPVIAGGLTALGALGTNENSTPPKH
jgi:hypothetical protein